MDKVYVAIQYKKRMVGGRVYKMTGGCFHEMLAAVKEAGVWSERQRIWILSQAAVLELKKQFEVEAEDFVVRISETKYRLPFALTLRSRFLDEDVLRADFRSREEAEEAAEKLIAAYRESDEAFEKVAMAVNAY